MVEHIVGSDVIDPPPEKTDDPLSRSGAHVMFLFKAAHLLLQTIDALHVDLLGDRTLLRYGFRASIRSTLSSLPFALPFGWCLHVKHRSEQDLKGLSIHLHRKLGDRGRFLK